MIWRKFKLEKLRIRPKLYDLKLKDGSVYEKCCPFKDGSGFYTFFCGDRISFKEVEYIKLVDITKE